MSKITFKRTFHPIGQGAFYTEIISKENINICRVVYDCGTNSSQRILKNEINNTFDKDDTIDILLLSHLHADHVSGIGHLKERCRIKTVVLPLLNDFEKLIVNLDLIVHDIDSGILNPQQYFGEDTNIIYVSKSDNEEAFRNELPLIISESINISEIRSGSTIILEENSFWKYTVFNLTNHSDYGLFNNLLIEKGIDKKRLTEVEYFEKEKKALLSCYTEVYKDLNESSLIVYSEDDSSGSLNIISDMIIGKSFEYRREQNKTGCLYTGDANLSQSEQVDTILNKLKSYTESTAIFQIPHHGSKNNMSHDAFRLLPADHFGVCVVSAGSKRSKHPSKELLGEILYYGRLPLLVTEESVTKVYHNIKFSYDE